MKNHCLLVLTDRRSRHQIIRLIPNKTTESVNQALEGILREHHILSITADNGTEFSRLAECFLRSISTMRIPTFMGEGTNENHNRLIRRWLPKEPRKRPERSAFIENWMNNYPKNAWTTSLE